MQVEVGDTGVTRSLTRAFGVLGLVPPNLKRLGEGFPCASAGQALGPES